MPGKYEPFNLKQWVEENRDLLKPPVGNKCLYKDSNFIIMAVGGPNRRTDFHYNETDEFFYQLEGDITLRVVDDEGEFRDITIREGDVYLLKGKTPHSPQRPENTVGLVVEKTREKGDTDGLQWYCYKCGNKLYEEYFFLEDIETQFGAVFDRYYDSEHTKCKKCGHVNGREWK